MTGFSAIWKDSGFLKATPPFLVVPYEGVALVYLNGVRNLDVRRDLKFDVSLTVTPVTQGNMMIKLMEYAENFPARLQPDIMARASDIRTALQFSSSVLCVEGSYAGATVSLDYVGRDKRGPAKMDVYTVKRRTVPVAFRFIRYLDDQGQPARGTTHSAAEAEGLVAVMNRLYMPSANIEIVLKSARDVTIAQQLGPALSKDGLYRHVAPLKDGSADMTIFFVGKWKGDTDPLGSAFHDINCIVVDDAPHQYIAPEGDWPPNRVSDDQLNWSKDRKPTDRDLFIVLAHEIAHLLGAGHNDEPDNLMSMNRQDLKLSKGTVQAIGGK